MKEFFSFTNPLHQHLCWYPDALQGDVRRVNGVPVTIFAGASLASALQGGSAVPSCHFAVAFQFAAAAADPAAAPVTEVDDLFAAVTPEQQLQAGHQSLQALVQQAAQQAAETTVAAVCSSAPTLMTLATTDLELELESLSVATSHIPAVADPLPLLTFPDGSVRDPLLTPAAAGKSAAGKRNLHRMISSLSRLMQQLLVVLAAVGSCAAGRPCRSSTQTCCFPASRNGRAAEAAQLASSCEQHGWAARHHRGQASDLHP